MDAPKFHISILQFVNILTVSSFWLFLIVLFLNYHVQTFVQAFFFLRSNLLFSSHCYYELLLYQCYKQKGGASVSLI